MARTSTVENQIRSYLVAVMAHLAGPKALREQATAELREHLLGAAEAGELDEAIERLGAPEQAAATFSRPDAISDAPVARRFAAAALDNLPLLGLSIALLVQNILATPGDVSATFPPFVYLQFDQACIALLPFVGGCGFHPSGLLYAIGMPIALAWSIVGLGILEGRNGVTPGKRLLGMEVVSQAGTRAGIAAGITRRVTFLVGPFAWFDWLPTLWGEPRRFMDKVAGTRVVHSDGHDRRPG